MTLYTIITLLAIANGIGTDPSEVNNPAFLSLALKYWWHSQVLYILTSSFLLISACLSIASQLSRDSVNVAQVYQRLVIYTVLVTGMVLNGWYFHDWLLQCAPTSHYWMGWIGSEGTCVKAAELAIRDNFVTTSRVAVGFAVLVLAKRLYLKRENMDEKSSNGFKGVLGIGCLSVL